MDEQINSLIERTTNFTKKLETKYPKNIVYLLNVIIPAFIIKYGYREERKILKIFEEVPLFIREDPSSNSTAYFARSIVNDGKDFSSIKEIVIQKYQNSSLAELLDSIIHEYNHAINSWENEFKEDDKYLYMRTGLSYIVYDKLDFSNREEAINLTLEEIINTRQTETIIDIIRELASKNISNDALKESLDFLHSHIRPAYKSNAYLLQTTLSKKLIENRSFLPSLERLRYSGHIEDIAPWFDEITGEKNSFNKLSKLLDLVIKKEQNLYSSKFFIKHKIRKIKTLINQIDELIDLYDQNSIYK